MFLLLTCVVYQKGDITMSEEEKVKEIFDRAARGESMGNKLGYDSYEKRLRPLSYCDPDKVTRFANQDSHLYGPRRGGRR